MQEAQDLLRQKELIKSFCNSNNYTISAILEDDGISGTATYITQYNTYNIDESKNI